ncbi:MAG: tetratricopeptide repeat protein [Bacteroidales bacterium]|jgi:tetratricopeptide (TPR) repeat protein|nr:tetratricopeptide repeat protein [Bacteroidales bacterium]MDD2569845.1 tetratricopeptide repeat protein [Bacteroidales bacterium]MDD2811808.1 tetratricopeptide repeat protein [Bacteroidales bacterium]MDD3384720.1 tetratricopeptide repeat protein [Bacteroidales bacterium]MDD3810968.1 tetratricopeptide repeat protein [Bacteroidales bacterium]
MKRFLFLLAGLFVFSSLIGQSNKVVTAWNLIKPEYNELDKAMQAIDEASVHSRTAGDAKTWYYRGLVYYKIYQSKDEKFKNLHPDPLKVAYESFIKAKELDTKDRWKDELRFRITQTSADYFNRGSLEYENKKYEESLNSFETVIAIGKLPYINVVDTGSFFNAAIAADQAKIYDKALDYYYKSAELNYGGPEVFYYIGEIYKIQGDTTAALDAYKVGIEKYPENNVNLYLEIINYYLPKNQITEVFSFIEKALEKDPNNHLLWNVYGQALEQKEDMEKAAEAYTKAVEIDSTFFVGWYNIGRLNYNLGVNAQEAANQIPLNDEAGFKAAVEVADNHFKAGLPYFEKAFEINPNDPDLLTALRQIYYRFKMNDKLDAIQHKIDEIK